MNENPWWRENAGLTLETMGMVIADALKTEKGRNPSRLADRTVSTDAKTAER